MFMQWCPFEPKSGTTRKNTHDRHTHTHTHTTHTHTPHTHTPTHTGLSCCLGGQEPPMLDKKSGFKSKPTIADLDWWFGRTRGSKPKPPIQNHQCRGARLCSPAADVEKDDADLQPVGLPLSDSWTRLPKFGFGSKSFVLCGLPRTMHRTQTTKCSNTSPFLWKERLQNRLVAFSSVRRRLGLPPPPRTPT